MSAATVPSARPFEAPRGLRGRRGGGATADAVRELLAPLARGEARVSCTVRASSWGVLPYELWIAPDGMLWRPATEGAGAPHRVAPPADVQALLADPGAIAVGWNEIATAALRPCLGGGMRLDLDLVDGARLAVVWDVTSTGDDARTADVVAAAFAWRRPSVLTR